MQGSFCYWLCESFQHNILYNVCCETNKYVDPAKIYKECGVT